MFKDIKPCPLCKGDAGIRQVGNKTKCTCKECGNSITLKGEGTHVEKTLRDTWNNRR